MVIPARGAGSRGSPCCSGVAGAQPPSMGLLARSRRALHVQACRAGERAELVADFGFVEARGLLREELSCLAAQGVAEYRVDDRLGEGAQALQGLGQRADLAGWEACRHERLPHVAL